MIPHHQEPAYRQFVHIQFLSVNTLRFGKHHLSDPIGGRSGSGSRKRWDKAHISTPVVAVGDGALLTGACAHSPRAEMCTKFFGHAPGRLIGE